MNEKIDHNILLTKKAFKKEYKPDKRLMCKSKPERYEILEKRIDLKMRLDRAMKVMAWRHWRLELDRDSDRKVKGRYFNQLFADITGLAKRTIVAHKHAHEMPTNHHSLKACEAMLDMAMSDLGAMTAAVQKQFDLIAEIHALVEIARDRRLYNLQRYPPGNPVEERTADRPSIDHARWREIRHSMGCRVIEVKRALRAC